ncbi:MAG TPA: hypothetical protein VF132_05900 [Rudaea sp.]
MPARAQRFYFAIDDLHSARGKVDSLSFHGDAPDAFAAELQSALRQPALFERWRSMQPDPDAVDPSLGASDATATVSAKQSDLNTVVTVVTVLPHAILKHRMSLLIGSHWTLRDVSSA